MVFVKYLYFLNLLLDETVVKSFNEHEIEDNSQPAFNKSYYI